MQADFETAYAKINLALHVRRRREDGYHELESLVAFLDAGDFLEVEPAEKDSFVAQGDYADHIGDPDRNLVLKALKFAREQLMPVQPLAIRLGKNLPVAAGLGGGSADAAALLRILHRYGLPFSPSEYAVYAQYLGADVPACLFSAPLVMRGIGEKIDAVEDGSLNGKFVVLVNPNIAVPTGPVFKAWDGADRGGLPDGTALEMALSGRNDLQNAAISICPQIADILAALSSTKPLVARMSGSGATCFAMYDTSDQAVQVAEDIRSAYPDWWVREGGLTRW